MITLFCVISFHVIISSDDFIMQLFVVLLIDPFHQAFDCFPFSFTIVALQETKDILRKEFLTVKKGKSPPNEKVKNNYLILCIIVQYDTPQYDTTQFNSI